MPFEVIKKKKLSSFFGGNYIEFENKKIFKDEKFFFSKFAFISVKKLETFKNFYFKFVNVLY